MALGDGAAPEILGSRATARSGLRPDRAGIILEINQLRRYPADPDRPTNAVALPAGFG